MFNEHVCISPDCYKSDILCFMSWKFKVVLSWCKVKVQEIITTFKSMIQGTYF